MRVFDKSPERHDLLSAWLYAQWETLEDGEARIAFPPGEDFFSGLRRTGDTLRVDPGGFRCSFLVHCVDHEARITTVFPLF